MFTPKCQEQEVKELDQRVVARKPVAADPAS